MDRAFYLGLAREQLAMPIGTDLVLREKPNHEDILVDGIALGNVCIEAAARYRSPLAIALMDLRVEKAELLAMLKVRTDNADEHHMHDAVTPDMVDRLREALAMPPGVRMKANMISLETVARVPGLVPVGMSIGPFSLATKLLDDPILPAYSLGSGELDDPDVRSLLNLIDLATLTVIRSIELQASAGAKAICLCEPAANRAYISPIQLDQGSDVFDRLVMQPNRKIAKRMDELGVDLIFHDCGELVTPMLKSIASLRPKMLSLGSSRRLWEDASLVDKDVVMFGNLPTKKFYSDLEMPIAEVERRTRELLTQMKSAKHPFVLGSECDVLSVPEHHRTIAAKVDRMLAVAREMN
jgi:uroporphyrinogen-III decarboxylase